jgi:DNA-binding CsgD family transcriptional regulator
MSEEAKIALVGSLYDAIGEPGAVAHIMSTLAHHMGAQAAFWYVIRKGASGRVSGPGASNPFLFDGQYGFDPDALDIFHEEMWRHDYALDHASTTERTTETHELISQAQLERSPYVNWLKSVAGVDRRIARSTDLAAGTVAGWSFHMPTGRERTAVERLDFDRFAAPVRHLFRLTSLFGESDSRHAALEQVIDTKGMAMLLLATDGRILWVSRAAHMLSLAADGIDCLGNRLSFHRSRDNQAFDTLLKRAASRDAIATGSVLAQMAIPRQSGKKPFVLELGPAAAPFQQHMHGAGVFTVMIHDPERMIDPRPERWCAIFGFTPTEARVAALTMRGAADASIAAALAIGIGTVRTHQKQVQAKTETKSKAEVAHLLTRLS